MKAQWTAFKAMMKTSKKAQAMAVIVLILFVAILFDVLGKKQMVAVEIYKHIESGDLIYCATGALTGPHHVHQGSGVIEKGKESHC